MTLTQTIQLIKELILHVYPLTFPPPLYLLLIPHIKLMSPKKKKEKEIFQK